MTTETTSSESPAPTLSSCLWPAVTGFCLTALLAMSCRLLEWPVWQNPEYHYGDEMLLATHDAYHWVAGACGFGAAVGHPMAILLDWLARITGLATVNAAFWFPAFMAGLVAALVFLWGLILGGRQTAIAAGLIASISPGFLGRTLLGFYDTDLVTLFFPLLITIFPALWCKLFLLTPAKAWQVWRKGQPADEADSLPPHFRSPDAPACLLLLAASGLVAYYTQQWHSLFPYLVRYNVFLLLFLILCLARIGQRPILLWSALAYALPVATGEWGLLFLLPGLLRHFFPASQFSQFLCRKSCLIPLWILTLAFLARGEILNTLLYQINAYLKHSGDAHSSGTTSLVFPSVAQSIIEVQDLSLLGLFSYFHPWLEIAVASVLGFIIIIFARPVALFLLPLAVLGFLSSRLGGRMVMFGAPIAGIGITLPIYWLFSHFLRKYWRPPAIGRFACCVLSLLLVVPFLDMISALSQGPILNRRHASALAQAGALTPPDAVLWLWWDWGYAAHYFARRQTIADGARHGGPSLYLPAAVFATENPRFARQVIRYASVRNNEPGDFFRDKTPEQAQELINRLRSPETPLVAGAGRQYVIVSFEMLKLGFWISNFGNWNFVTRQGEGGALSIVPEAVAYRLNAGEVRLAGSSGIIFPISINIFAETGVTRRDYAREWFAAHPNATAAQQEAWLASRRNINFLFNRVTDEKLAVDQGIYNSLMVQLLLCDAHDQRFTPYFRLIYDNVFTRIYEVVQ